MKAKANSKKASKPTNSKNGKSKKSPGVPEIFGLKVTTLSRGLGKAGLTPAEAVRAIHSYIPTASAGCIMHHAMIGAGTMPIPTLSKAQVKEMKKKAVAA